MDESIDDTPSALGGDIETEIKEMMGLFDAPSFARRGLELEEMLRRVDLRCRQARSERLEMVRLRLKQWAGVASGPGDAATIFEAPIDPLWPLSDAEPPRWTLSPAPRRRQLSVARDLIASVERFNRRWDEFLGSINLDAANTVIDHYNRFYVIEKECVMGSGRLAARFFTPVSPMTVEEIRRDHPMLPVPSLIAR